MSKYCLFCFSIHNYSSLYAEFYCISHYQQLFKQKGNYDEGFGHRQHKDRWLQKNRGLDEPDSCQSSKTTNSNLGPSDSSRESSAGVFVEKSSVREQGYNSGADVKGKLKISWPPEKKNTGVNPSQKTKIPDAGKAASVSLFEHQMNHRNPLQISDSREAKDKLVLEQTTGFTSTESDTKESKLWSNAATDSISLEVHNFSSSSKQGFNVTNQKTGQENVAHTSQTTGNKLDLHQNKARKSVRFSQSVDVAHYDLSSQLTSGAKKADQPEQPQVNKPNDTNQKKSNCDHPPSELSNKQRGRDMNLEFPEYKSHGEKTTMSNPEPDGKVDSGHESPQAGVKDDATNLNGAAEKADEILDTKSLTATTQDVSTHQEPSDQLHVSPGNADSTCDADVKPGTLHSSAGQMTKEEENPESTKNPFEKNDSTNDEENGGSQKKPVARTNSKVRLGSWSKGKSPLSKLFTSGGTEITNKAESKGAKKPDVKPSGLLGRLFQSSSEKAADITTAARDERNDKAHVDDKKTEQIKEVITKEVQKEDNIPQVPDVEQDAGDDTQEKSHPADFSKPDINNDANKSTESFNTPRTSARETGNDITASNQTSDSQSSETTALFLTDPGTSDSKDLSSTVQSENQASEDSINLLPAEKDGDEVWSEQFNDNMFGNIADSGLTDLLAIQTKTEEYTQKSNELLLAPAEGLFDFNSETPQPTSDLFSLSDSQEIFGNIPTDMFSSSVSEVASAESLTVLDPQPFTTEMMLSMTDEVIVPDSAPLRQNGSDTSDPFGANIQLSGHDSDIFSDILFTLPPLVDGADEAGADASDPPATQPSTFPDDIFGFTDISNPADVFTAPPNSSASSNSLSDLTGSNASSSAAAPTAHIDIFADDIFSSGPQLLPVSVPNASEQMDSILVSDINNAAQAAGNTVTNTSWMDDLLG